MDILSLDSLQALRNEADRRFPKDQRLYWLIDAVISHTIGLDPAQSIAYAECRGVSVPEWDKAPAPVPVEPPTRRLVNPAYETVLGYLKAHHPRAYRALGVNACEDTQRDGFWLTHRARERGYEIVKVKAPDELRAEGIETVNAYPLVLLRERFAYLAA